MTPADGLRSISLHREIPSRLVEVDVLCREIRSLLMGKGLAEVSFPVELLAREFLNNAVIHGNRGDASKKVALNLRIKRKWISLRISDEGSGFNWRKARRAPPPDQEGVSGRGLSFSTLYAQRIAFNQRGNQVTLWLKR
jgi:serine/threonine-protein kinase RsbW